MIRSVVSAVEDLLSGLTLPTKDEVAARYSIAERPTCSTREVFVGNGSEVKLAMEVTLAALLFVCSSFRYSLCLDFGYVSLFDSNIDQKLVQPILHNLIGFDKNHAGNTGRSYKY